MNDKMRIPVAVIAILVIAGSAFALVRRHFHKEPVADTTVAYQGMGEVVAEEGAKIAGGNGRVILLTPSGEPGKNPIAQAVQRGGGSRIAPVAPTNAKPMDAEALAEFAKQNSAGAVVVFESAVDLRKLLADGKPDTGSGIVLVTGDWGTAKELIEKKIIRSAIVPRTSAPESSEPPKTPREWFDNFYQVIDASNLGSLPKRN